MNTRKSSSRFLSQLAIARRVSCLVLTVCFGHQIGVSHAALISWDSDDGYWSTPGNWSPAGPPDIGDAVFLGNIPAIENYDVLLDQNDAVASLTITDGMTFSNRDYTFSVIGDTSLSGLNLVPVGTNGTAYNHSRIFIRPTPAPIEFTTRDLNVTDEARVRLYEGGDIEVRRTMFVDSVSSLYGEGSVRLIRDGLALVNSGTIDPAAGGIDIDVTNGGVIDLDGSGSGQVLLEWGGESLTINGGQLTDPFSGVITIDGDTSLNMNLDAPWIADASSEIIFGYAPNGNQTTQSIITGADLTIAGEAPIWWGAHARLDANVTLAPTADILVRPTALFESNAEALVEGGTFVVEEDGEMRFDGPTTVEGGDFTTFSNLGSDGFVRFNGETTWRGIVTVNGVAQQFGDASVNGLTVINAGVFDLDGGGNTEWNVGHLFTVTAESIDSTLSNTFDGTINIGAVLGNLSIQLNGAFDQWVMNGEMNITNNLPFSSEKIDGSPMRLAGDLRTDGLVRFSADTTFGSGSQTTFADAEAVLALQQLSHVEAGATFVGVGTLQNQSSGEMTLADGATLGQVGLLNEGLLEVGDSPGVASVDSFMQGNESTWLVEVGGYLAGDEFDLLQVIAGDAELDGNLVVELIDAGGGLFLPQVGDEFTILTSLGDVLGSFSADPISFAAGQEFHWDVIYNPHDVTLQLVEITNVVPEPASAAILPLAALIFTSRRCRQN